MSATAIDHRRAVRLLSELATGRPLGGREADRRALETHVAGCEDCWRMLADAHRAVAGRLPPDATHALSLYVCEQVRDRFHALVCCDTAEMERRDPAVVAHLRSCDACRVRFAELVRTEAAIARGALEELGPAPLERIDSGTEAAVSPVARLVIALREGLAGFADVPAWMAATPLEPAPARGTTPEPHGLARRVELPEFGVTLAVRARAPERADLELVVHGGSASGGIVTLRSTDDRSLVGSHTVPADGVVLLRGVPRGRYVLIVPARGAGDDVRVEIDVR